MKTETIQRIGLRMVQRRYNTDTINSIQNITVLTMAVLTRKKLTLRKINTAGVVPDLVTDLAPDTPLTAGQSPDPEAGGTATAEADQGHALILDHTVDPTAGRHHAALVHVHIPKLTHTMASTTDMKRSPSNTTKAEVPTGHEVS